MGRHFGRMQLLPNAILVGVLLRLIVGELFRSGTVIKITVDCRYTEASEPGGVPGSSTGGARGMLCTVLQRLGEDR
jgi:hypothetical protein